MRGAIARACALAFVAFVAFFALVGSARAEAPDALATIAVRGQILAIDSRYVIFTSGDAVRLRMGTPIPKGTTLGVVVVVTIDRASRDAIRVARDSPPLAGEISASELPRDYVVVAPKSARTLAPVATIFGAGSASEGAPARATVTLEVTVPSNTPPSDDVYVSTDRSNYGPAEIRMQRIDSRRFTATVALDANGRLRYLYTRGNYDSVERDRSGGIVRPHVVDRDTAKTDDVVTRWADVN